jgi:hypothetical protein
VFLGLTEIEFRRGIPRLGVAPAVGQIERTGPVLVLGTLPPEVRAELVREEVEIVSVTTLQQAIENLASLAFRAVAVSPEIPGAIDLVKHVKLGKQAAELEGIWEAASRNMLTPIIVLPFAGEDEYAVIVVPPAAAFLERIDNVRIAYALLRLDVGALLGPTPRN